MNLEEQKITGQNELHVTDSLNASLLALKIKSNENTITPDTNDLLIYVDKSSNTTVTENRKQYLFNLSSSLKCVGNVSDEFQLGIVLQNNEPVIKAIVKRMIGVSEEGNYVLDTPLIEELEGYPLILFEGENYIYTNYNNASLEIIYPKDTEFNRLYLSSVVYCGHKLNSTDDFSLDDIYFKDAFTKTENKLNLEVNHASVDCLSSNNNKFSLDSEGNLIVNSITYNTHTPSNVIDIVYPVGSIYMSVNDISPESLFGGTWEQLKDKFLLGAGDNYINGSIGGEETHKLTVNEMPSHTHSIAATSTSGTTSNFTRDSATRIWDNGKCGSTGGNQAHNNMPPYLAVYMWKRVN